jgi:flagellar biosynthesis component FlhA
MKLDELGVANLTDEQLSRILTASTRNTLILALIFASVLALVKGWPTGLLMLIGGLISASGIHEWKRLVRAINASLDSEKGSRTTARVAVLFLVRLALAVGVLYVSLKFLHGSPFALVGGLSLAAISLCYQALQLLRQ